MNSPHLLLFSLIALLTASSVICILFVTIQNHRALKQYHKMLPVSGFPQEKLESSFDPEDYEEISFFPKKQEKTPVYATKKEFSLVS